VHFIGKRKLDRRTLLRGAGVAVALPFLDAMVPARVRAANRVAPTRAAFIYVPNGMIMPRWTPVGEDRAFEMSPTLAPLSDLKNDITVLSGLNHHLGSPLGDGPGDHARAQGNYLTGARPLKNATFARVGISIDQRIAQVVGDRTRFPSLELTCDRGLSAGSCDSGYNCSYQSTMSWRSETVPQPAEVDPRRVFDRLFSKDGNAASRTAVQKRRDRSVLDFVIADSRRLNNDVSPADRMKLDEYLSAVRAVEHQLEQSGKFGVPEAPGGSRKPATYPDNYTEHLQLMGELMCLAFQSDSTRVVSFLFAREGSERTYAAQGGHEGHHAISHHQNNPEKIEILARIDHFHAEQLGHILRRMKSIREGDGTLLDSVFLTYGSGLSDGNKHLHTNIPTLVAGRANGGIGTGRHLKMPDGMPMSNVWLSVLHSLGIQDERFGDSTGTIPALAS